MAQKYKLIYFNGAAKGEVARLIFAQAGVDYEDTRVEFADWSTYKPKTPNGQLPVFEVDGASYCQSNAIGRYLAREYGLYGKTAEDGLRVDMIVDTVEDMLKSYFVHYTMKDEEKKAEAKKKLEDEELPQYFKNLEKMLIANNGGDGFFVGDQVSWADLMFFHWSTWPTWATPPIGAALDIKVDLSKVPKLEALNDRVKNLPRIAAWLAKRPATAF